MASACSELYCLNLGHEYIPRELIREGGGDEIVRLPFTTILVHSPDGWFLFDLGLRPEIANDPNLYGNWWKWGPPEVPAGPDPVLDSLERCGVAPREVAGVIISHLHVDHTGGLRHFVDGPPVYIQRDELEYGLAGRDDAWGFWPPDYDDERIRWQPIVGDEEIATGIHAISTPGHSPGHMSYRIEMQQSGQWVFAFDAIVTVENVELDSPVNVGTRPEDAPLRRTSHDRLVALSRTHDARLIPGHCPVTWPTLESPPGRYQ
jgi:N-acyl homoserine lactone hydrolase